MLWLAGMHQPVALGLSIAGSRSSAAQENLAADEVLTMTEL